MKINNWPIIRRFSSVMEDVGCEHLAYPFDQLEGKNLTAAWFKNKAKFILSLYYEEGNCRCFDRFDGPDAYKIWISETGKLKRLITRLEKLDDDELIVDWEEKA